MLLLPFLLPLLLFRPAGTGLGHALLCNHPCVPYALTWGAAICAAGNDSRVVLYDANGRSIQSFDYSADDSVRLHICNHLHITIISLS